MPLKAIPGFNSMEWQKRLAFAVCTALVKMQSFCQLPMTVIRLKAEVTDFKFP